MQQWGHSPLIGSLSLKKTVTRTVYALSWHEQIRNIEKKKPFSVECWSPPQDFKFGHFVSLFGAGEKRNKKTMISARAARLTPAGIIFHFVWQYVKITETHVRFFFVCLTSLSTKRKQDVSSGRSHSSQEDKWPGALTIWMEFSVITGRIQKERRPFIIGPPLS